MEKPYLKIYKHCAKTGKLPQTTFKHCRIHVSGLCSLAGKRITSNSYTLLNIVAPTHEDLMMVPNKTWWGSGSTLPLEGELTPLRANLLLLMACLNNEL